MSSFFGAFRSEGFPTQFDAYQTAANVDVLEAGFILAFAILAFCFYLVLAGFHRKFCVPIFVRVTTSLFIGAVLMTSNFGQDWEVGHITSKTPYKAGQGHEIKAKIGLKLGLRSLNITLLRAHEVEHKENPLDSEIINYNERFWWTWDQGRLGFGPYAGQLQQDFRHAQRRGLPLPILWVADYFTVDGEGFRFGRYYRTAGWYTHIAMWSAFPCWLLANILFLSTISYGVFFILMTGLLQILACILWASIRNPIPLVISFEDGELRTTFGVNYWLTLATGILCIAIGIVILVFDLRFPDKLAVFFGTDPLASYEECHLTRSEIDVVRQKEFGCPPKIELTHVRVNSTDVQEPERTEVILRRRRSAIHTKFRYRTPIQANGEDDDDQPLYLNVPLLSRGNSPADNFDGQRRSPSPQPGPSGLYRSPLTVAE